MTQTLTKHLETDPVLWSHRLAHERNTQEVEDRRREQVRDAYSTGTTLVIPQLSSPQTVQMAYKKTADELGLQMRTRSFSYLRGHVMVHDMYVRFSPMPTM